MLTKNKNMLELKGKRDCLFVKSEIEVIDNLAGEIEDEKVKFVFFYIPKEFIDYLYNNEIKFELKYFGKASVIYVNLSECEFVDGHN